MDQKFSKHILSFVDRIEALRSCLPIMASLTTFGISTAGKDFIDYLKKHCNVIEENDKSLKVKIPEEQFTRFYRYQKQIKRFGLTQIIIPSSFIVTLISQYDFLVGEIIKFIYKVQPNILVESEKIIHYEDLLNYSSIDELKNSFIDKEVDSVLRENHDKQLSYFEKKLKISLRSDKNLISRFIEITERRNIFVHCDGRVNNHYLNKCVEAGYCFDNKLSEGELLSVSPKYFFQAVDTILEIGTKLSYIIWNKLLPTENEEIQQSITSVGYELIFDERYELARILLNFALDLLIKDTSPSRKYIAIINIAQSYKWQNLENECKEILGTINWDCLSTMFQIAFKVLTDDYTAASKLMYVIKESGELSKAEYQEWPLFKNFRESTEFKEAYRNIFGDDFESFTKNEPKSISDVLTDIINYDSESKDVIPKTHAPSPNNS